MKKLLVLRHADAELEADSDFERILTQKGIDSVVSLADELRDSLPIIEVVLSSSAFRAFQTASIFIEQLGLNSNIIKSSRTIYDAGTSDIFRALGELPNDVGCALVVGHNPIMCYFVNMLLVDPIIRFPKAGLVQMDFNCECWFDISQLNLVNSYYYFM